MLARTVKTAEELGITVEEHTALLGVLKMLELEEVQYEHWESLNTRIPHGKKFNLGVSCAESDCGTIACIGGWAAQLMGMTASESGHYVCSFDPVLGKKYDSPLSDLFWPRAIPTNDYNVVTVEQACQAICNFLATGTPSWKEVLSVNK